MFENVLLLRTDTYIVKKLKRLKRHKFSYSKYVQVSCNENGSIEVRRNGKTAVFQTINEIDSSQISLSQERSNDSTESTEESHMQQNEEKLCYIGTFANDPIRVTMNEKVDWTCAKIQKIKELLGRSRKQIHKARVNRFFSPQRHQYDLRGAGNQGDCFVFYLFKNRTSQLEKEIS